VDPGCVYGLIPAVIAIVLSAVKRIGSKALKTPALWSIALLAFVAIFFLKLPFVWIILTAALAGFIGGKKWPKQFPAGKGHGKSDVGDAPFVELPPAPQASWRRSFMVSAICLTLWWLPVLACGLLLGWGGIHFQQGLFFSKAALVTIGGAYAVLPYVAQMAVEHHTGSASGR
jgi:chromate transporter